MIMFTWGETYFKVSDMRMGMQFNEQAKALGFKDKDVMLGTDKAHSVNMLISMAISSAR